MRFDGPFHTPRGAGGMMTQLDAIAELERQVGEAAGRDEIVLPPYPAVALRVQQAIAHQDFGAPEVARIIAADSALAADVLRCANSAFYRRGSTVASLPQAIARIGSQQVLRLAFTCVLAGRAHATGALAPIRRRVWIEAVASAAICQELARLRGLPANEAFTLGLLHDFGKIVAIWRLEALLDRDGCDARAPHATWMGVVERQHVALGLALAKRWNLPPLMAEVIAAHHGGAHACQDRALLEAVRTSDAIVAALVADVGVHPGALAGVAGLGAEEQRTLGPVIDRLPDFIASFEPPSPAERPTLAKGAVEDAPLPTVPVANRFAVSVRVAGRALGYSAVAVGEGALVVAGQEPLSVNRLVSTTMSYEPDPFTIWTLPQSSRAARAGHEIELRPFGLDAQARARWSRLLVACRPGGARLRPVGA